MIYLITRALLIFGYAAAQQNCDFRQNVGPTERYYFYNPGYPRNYPANTMCRYVATCSAGYNIRLDCNISMPSSSGCSGDRFLVSATGDPTLAGAAVYCGVQRITVVSINQQLSVGVTATINSGGGLYACTLVAQRVPTTPPPTCTCGIRRRNRIVGGRETGVNEYTMMAAVIERSISSLLCGATIISTWYLVSAAHCLALFRNRPDQLVASIGDHYIENRNPNNMYAIAQFIIHENFNPNTFDYDIALVRLSRRITFNVNVLPACLPFKFSSSNELIGRLVTVLGWGLTEPGGMTANGLRSADVTVIDRPTCAQTDSVTLRQFCTRTPGRDACQYDSGGPVLYEDPASALLFLMGVISSGNGCGSTRPAIQTDVVALLRWILNNANDNFCIIR